MHMNKHAFLNNKSFNPYFEYFLNQKKTPPKPEAHSRNRNIFYSRDQNIPKDPNKYWNLPIEIDGKENKMETFVENYNSNLTVVQENKEVVTIQSNKEINNIQDSNVFHTPKDNIVVSNILPKHEAKKVSNIKSPNMKSSNIKSSDVTFQPIKTETNKNDTNKNDTNKNVINKNVTNKNVTTVPLEESPNFTPNFNYYPNNNAALLPQKIEAKNVTSLKSSNANSINPNSINAKPIANPTIAKPITNPTIVKPITNPTIAKPITNATIANPSNKTPLAKPIANPLNSTHVTEPFYAKPTPNPPNPIAKTNPIYSKQNTNSYPNFYANPYSPTPQTNFMNATHRPTNTTPKTNLGKAIVTTELIIKNANPYLLNIPNVNSIKKPNIRATSLKLGINNYIEDSFENEGDATDEYTGTLIINTLGNDNKKLDKIIKSGLKQEGMSDMQIIISTREGDCSEKLYNRKYHKNPNVVISKVPIKDHPGRGPQGIFAQLNKASELVKNKWVSYFSGNDVIFRSKFRREIDHCIKNNKSICYSTYLKELNGKRTKLVFKKYNYDLHLKGNFVNDCSLIKTTIFKNLLPFKLDYHNHAFWDFFLRAYERYGNIFVYNEVPTWKYIVTNNSSHIKRFKNKNLKKVNDEHKKLMLLRHQTSLQPKFQKKEKTAYIRRNYL